MPLFIYDGYLELFSERAPVGGFEGHSYRQDLDWDYEMEVAVVTFEQQIGTKVYCLGRSGRHICVDDTPDNRERYEELCQAAAAAAYDFWHSLCMGDPPAEAFELFCSWVESEDLDEMVREQKACEAEALNNGGTKHQVAYLLHGLGDVERKRLLHQIADTCRDFDPQVYRDDDGTWAWHLKIPYAPKHGGFESETEARANFHQCDLLKEIEQAIRNDLAYASEED